MTKQKALCVATRCNTAAQFIETFHRFCDEQSFFVATMNMRPVGLETPFSIQLADKTPVLRGLCVVLAAWTTPANPYKRPGIRLGIRRLTPESEDVFYQLQAMRTGTPQEIVTEASEAFTETPVPVALPPIPTTPRVSPPARKATPRAGSVISVPPKREPTKPEPTVVDAKPAELPEEQRTPGSDLVLPANPLMNLSDKSLAGFVDCTLYEETGNFFPALDDGSALDELAPPPGRLPANPLANIDELEPQAGIASAPEAVDVAPEPIAAAEPVAPLEPPTIPVVAASPAPPPIVEESPSRVTPMPAGEAFVAPKAAAPRTPSNKRWWVLAGATVAASLAALLVMATRSSADESSPPRAAKPATQIADTAMKPAGSATEPTPSESPNESTEPPTTEPPTTEPPTEPPPTEPPIDPPMSPKKSTEPSNPSDEPATTTSPSPIVGKGPCKVDIKTTPAGTMVEIDGRAVGPSPIAIAGPCTRRRIDLAHPRYKAEQRWVTPTADQPVSLDITLVRPTHELVVTSNPAGATVSIGGRRAGLTPTKVQLMGFSGIDITITKPGFETITRRIYSKVPNDALTVTMRRELFFKK